MQRSEALAPLSRDHHHALVTARRLTRATPADAAQAAGAFVEFLTGHELTHFALEEAVLVPLARTTEEGRRLGTQMVNEHARLRDDLSRLQAGADSPDPFELQEIGRRLRDHVMFEERDLFPYLEQTLTEAALAGVGARLAEAADQR